MHPSIYHHLIQGRCCDRVKAGYTLDKSLFYQRADIEDKRAHSTSLTGRRILSYICVTWYTDLFFKWTFSKYISYKWRIAVKFALMPSFLVGNSLCISVLFGLFVWGVFSQGDRAIPNSSRHSYFQAGKKSHIRLILCTCCLLSYFAPSVDASDVVPTKLNFNKDIKDI